MAAGAACDVHAPVGGYLVLRFGPALASPEAFGVVDAPPPAGARRSLVLLSKLMQAAANGALPGAREPHMQPFDAWAQSATPRIAAFLDAAGAPAADGAPTDDAATISRPPTDAAEAELHRAFDRHAAKLSALLPESLQDTLAALGPPPPPKPRAAPAPAPGRAGRRAAARARAGDPTSTTA